MKKHLGFNIFVGIVISSVVIVVIVGLYVSGSPTQERARRLDETRVNQLQQITYAVETFANMHDTRLPSTLDELKNAQNVYLESITDPETGNEYEYTASGTSTYQLCATFALDSTQGDGQKTQTMPVYPAATAGFWNHSAGHACFSFQYTPSPAPKPLTTPVPVVVPAQ